MPRISRSLSIAKFQSFDRGYADPWNRGQRLPISVFFGRERTTWATHFFFFGGGSRFLMS